MIVHITTYFLIILKLIFQAFAAFDKNQCGALPVADFRRILDMFCFQLTDAQWKQLKGRLRILVDDQVDYALFMEQFVTTELDVSIFTICKHCGRLT